MSDITSTSPATHTVRQKSGGRFELLLLLCVAAGARLAWLAILPSQAVALDLLTWKWTALDLLNNINPTRPRHLLIIRHSGRKLFSAWPICRGIPAPISFARSGSSSSPAIYLCWPRPISCCESCGPVRIADASCSSAIASILFSFCSPCNMATSMLYQWCGSFSSFTF